MDSNEYVNIETENLNVTEDSLSSSIGKKRHRNTHSEVWEYFQKNETILGQTPTCFCKECKKTYFWGEKHGTSNMRKHIPKCSSITGKTIVFNETNKFDQHKYRDLVTKAVIRHNLPFMFVQYDGVREMLSYLNNKVEHFSRNTARSDVIKLYEKEKIMLKHFIKSCSGKVSLTSDLWTSINTDGFISLTAHFIDDDWVLQKKLLSFCLMPPPYSGAAIFGKVSSLLMEWNIEENLFACTLDNASSNDKFVELLESHLSFKNALVANGEFLHVRCTAHILNLMVQDGLKCISSFLANIRESIKYIKGSQSRKKLFVECIVDLSMDRSKKILQQDVPTRWNSTFLMLKSAIHFQHALCRLEVVDRSYTYCPTPDEWSELKSYIEDGLLDPKASFDILSFWKSQQYKYPILSSMAKDILAVPITTVASESAFSVGGRVLDDYRSSLKADIVEALLCSRDWLYGNATTSFVEQPDEDISVLQMDEESAI